MASAVTNLINLIFSTIYASRITELKEAWFFPDRTSFYGLIDYLKIGLPSYLMCLLDVFPFELSSVMSVYISVEAVATHSILINVLMSIFTLAVGLQNAAIVQIGHKIG